MLNKKCLFIISFFILSGLLLVSSLSNSDNSSTISVNTTIQAAVDAASPGDTVVIPSRVYKGEGNKNINITNKNLNIIGYNNMVIDAEHSGRIFDIVDSNVNITGLKIQNGFLDSNAGGALKYGGNSNGDITNCIFTNCSTGGYGGAVYLFGGGNVFNCTFTNTRSSISGGGGAIFIHGGGNVTSCTFTNTSSISIGGAIFIWGGCSISDCTFTNTYSDLMGGAIYLGNGGDVRRCNFTNANSGDSGGALFFADNGNVYGCTIVNCTSLNNGAGIYTNNGNININYNRIVNNKLRDGSLSNVYVHNGNLEFNWWGTNNIRNAGIRWDLPNNYYQIELSAGNYTSHVNSIIDGFSPLNIGYRMVLNNPDNMSDIDKLPDFIGRIELMKEGEFFKGVGDIPAKFTWENTISTFGNYKLSALVDAEVLTFTINISDLPIPPEPPEPGNDTNATSVNLDSPVTPILGYGDVGEGLIPTGFELYVLIIVICLLGVYFVKR